MRPTRSAQMLVTVSLLGLTLSACGDGTAPPRAAASTQAAARLAVTPSPTVKAPAAASASPSASPSPRASATASGRPRDRRPAVSAKWAAPGNPDGHAAVPAEARPVDTSHPNRVVGDGTPSSCTSQAVASAVAAGGVITFSCGPGPVTIRMRQTAKVRNTSARVVLDGGGRVTLDGGGVRRILYMNTCDQAQVWTTSHCNDQSQPELTVQNLTFAHGNSTGQTADGGGGGAIFDRGGRLKVINSRFVGNRCDSTGPDLGGAAVRVLDQYHGLPVYVVGSTFGGSPGQGGACSNGGALSSIGVSWQILNSVLTYNRAVGRGANPAKSGTPGGGSGGAVYADGNAFRIRIAGSVVAHNTANEGGGAVFFVSNDRTGTLAVQDSVLRRNPSAGFETPGLPGIFFLGSGRPALTGSTLG